MYYLPSEARFRFKPVCVRQVRSVREVDVFLTLPARSCAHLVVEEEDVVVGVSAPARQVKLHVEEETSSIGKLLQVLLW